MNDFTIEEKGYLQNMKDDIMLPGLKNTDLYIKVLKRELIKFRRLAHTNAKRSTNKDKD